MVDLLADTRKRGAVISSRLKGQPHADDFERVGEEDRGDTREGAGEESPEGYFLSLIFYNHGAYLLVGEKLDGRVREDAQEGCGVASKETAEPVLLIDVAHGGYDAEPGAGVLGELGVGGLEEDFDAVEGADDGFGLFRWNGQRCGPLYRREGLLAGRYVQHILPTPPRAQNGERNPDSAYFSSSSSSPSRSPPVLPLRRSSPQDHSVFVHQPLLRHPSPVAVRRSWVLRHCQ